MVNKLKKVLTYLFHGAIIYSSARELLLDRISDSSSFFSDFRDEKNAKNLSKKILIEKIIWQGSHKLCENCMVYDSFLF